MTLFDRNQVKSILLCAIVSTLFLGCASQFTSGGRSFTSPDQALAYQRQEMVRDVSSIERSPSPVAGKLAMSLPSREMIEKYSVIQLGSGYISREIVEYLVSHTENAYLGNIDVLRATGLFLQVVDLGPGADENQARSLGFDYFYGLTLIGKMKDRAILTDLKTGKSKDLSKSGAYLRDYRVMQQILHELSNSVVPSSNPEMVASPTEEGSLYKPKETRKSRGFSTGTGFFISVDGALVTNYHVIEEAREITVVTTGGKRLRAKLLKSDPVNDAAVLKVEGPSTPLPLADQCTVGRGDEVFTLGYPLITIQGQEQKATFGRINAISGVGDDVRFVQIDVPVQPGNSGGPLIDSQGRVVGVVTATVSVLATLRASGSLPQNVNYAVKSDYIIPLARAALGAGWRPVPAQAGDRMLKQLIEASEASIALIISRVTPHSR